ncbi:MAG: alpha/beta family hydrolase [Sandaracinaceae bacterium]
MTKTFEIEGLPVSWVRDGPLRDRPVLVLAHGAGASYHSVFMQETAAGLVKRGIAVVRFHFPYMERAHTSGTRRPPGPKRRLLATYREMVKRAAKLRGRGPLFIGGKSMGGRMASMILADDAPPISVVGAVYLGYPLHPSGRPEKLRSEHLPQVAVPQLFVSGTRDALATPQLLKPIVKRLPKAELLEVEGADHSLARSRKHPMRDADAWLDAVSGFVHRVAPVAQ